MLHRSDENESRGQETRKRIVNGILPNGLSLEAILSDLKMTKSPNILEAFGFLSAKQYRNGKLFKDHGLISCQLVTTAFADYIVDSIQNSTTSPMDAFNYHGTGTENSAEANTQTTLGTEVETREAGTKEEGASSNIFKTVATVTYSATRSIVEHGIFSASSGGTMMDRSIFTAVPVVDTDTIEFTYQLTVNAES